MIWFDFAKYLQRLCTILYRNVRAVRHLGVMMVRNRLTNWLSLAFSDTVAVTDLSLNPEEHDILLIAKYGLPAVLHLVTVDNQIPHVWPQNIRQKLLANILKDTEHHSLIEHAWPTIERMRGTCKQTTETLKYIGPPTGWLQCAVCIFIWWIPEISLTNCLAANTRNRSLQ